MTTSKRASANKSESEMKRVKLAMTEYEVVLGDEMYVNIDKLSNARSSRASSKNVEKGKLEVKPSYAPKTDVCLVEKNECIIRIIATTKEGSYPTAPQVIKDKDLTFFVDKAGASYQVEMRGERTMNGIYFKANDVGVVFESKDFVKTIQRPDISYRELVDYVWFMMQKGEDDLHNKQRAASDTSDQGHLRKSDISLQEQDHHSVQRASTKDVFLTFSGLMHALHNTRSPVAEEFRGWVYRQVFTLAYGSVEQKKEMLQTLCKIDKTFLQAFMKLVPNDLACIYLVDTTKREGGATVYKFGRLGMIKDRFFNRQFTYGDGTLLDTVIFIPHCFRAALSLFDNGSVFSILE